MSEATEQAFTKINEYSYGEQHITFKKTSRHE